MRGQTVYVPDTYARPSAQAFHFNELPQLEPDFISNRRNGCKKRR